MKPLSQLLMALFLGFLQGSMDIAWSLPGPPPDLLLLYILWLGFNRQTNLALIAAFLGGIAQDSVAHTFPIGVLAFTKVIIAYLPEWAHFILLPESRLTGILLVSGATLLHQIILFALIQTLEPGGIWGTGTLLQTLILLIWNLTVWFLTAHRLIPPPKEEEVSL